MTVLIVGDQPSAKNKDPNIPFIGARRYPRRNASFYKGKEMNTFYFLNWLQDHLGANYDIWHNSATNCAGVVHKTRHNEQITICISKQQALLMMSADSDDEAARLMRHFWGAPTATGGLDDVKYKAPKQELKLEEFRSQEGCSHDWHEVTLFNTPHARCKWCDIKKSSV